MCKNDTYFINLLDDQDTELHMVRISTCIPQLVPRHLLPAAAFLLRPRFLGDMGEVRASLGAQ